MRVKRWHTTNEVGYFRRLDLLSKRGSTVRSWRAYALMCSGTDNISVVLQVGLRDCLGMGAIAKRSLDDAADALQFPHYHDLTSVMSSVETATSFLV